MQQSLRTRCFSQNATRIEYSMGDDDAEDAEEEDDDAVDVRDEVDGSSDDDASDDGT